ncbi:arylamine N-acetyltransferase [Streptomyces sp. DW26H14]|uniref:arylamine N-acetyltransferase n=1 Tax=Streptomyces sp. DW26H14 TaxID=3435395 RepID=UPI00403DD12B
MNAGNSTSPGPERSADASDPSAPSPRLARYLHRLGLPGASGLTADAGTLRSLHREHTYALPFENIDPVRGIVPSLEADDLDAKLVRGGRGGYCYEHNTLLMNALVALGFGVTLLAARVLVGATDIASRPRTHMALLVDPADGSGARGGSGAPPYLADVGFGTAGALVEPVPLVADTEFTAEGRRHRLVHVPHEGPSPMWVLEAYGNDGWARQYGFTREPFERSDFSVVNWHIATNPRSPFARRLTVQRALPGGVHRSLSQGRFTESHAGAVVRSYGVRSDAALRDALADDFGITPPAGLSLGPEAL